MKYTEKEYKELLLKKLPNSDFDFLDFTGTEYPATIICNKCKKTYTFQVAANFAKRARRGNKDICSFCEPSKNNEIRASYQKILLESSIRPVENDLLEIRWSNKDSIKWRCIKCNHIFKKSPFNITMSKEGFKCPYCEATYSYLNNDIMDFQIKQFWGDEYSRVGEATKNERSQRRIKVRHNSCGFIWEVDWFHFIKEHTGCPRCKSSKGEKKVRDYLKSYNFSFLEQKTINLGKKGVLRLDFYLEIDNKKFAIEYNGIQHYKPVKYFGGEAAFQRQKKCDQDKKEYCKEQGIELIIIPYDNEELLNSELLAQRLRGQVPQSQAPIEG